MTNWQEITLISGLPFPSSPTALYNTEADTSSSTLLRSTHKAIASELKTGTIRELQDEVDLLHDHARNLDDDLQARTFALSDRDNKIYSLTEENQTLQIRLKKSEEDYLSRTTELESNLSNQNAKEKDMRSELQKTIQELNAAQNKNTTLTQQFESLQDNLRERAQTAKKHESNAIALVQTEARSRASVLEAKLQSVEIQLAKSEEREKEAMLAAQEARQEASSINQALHVNITNARRELTAQHRAEIDKKQLELDSARQDNTHLEDTNRNLTKQLNDADCRMKDIKHKLDGKTKECEGLQTELSEVSLSIGILNTCVYFSLPTISPYSMIDYQIKRDVGIRC